MREKSSCWGGDKYREMTVRHRGLSRAGVASSPSAEVGRGNMDGEIQSRQIDMALAQLKPADNSSDRRDGSDRPV